MFQTANIFKKSMSYNDYLMSASSSDEEDLENGWGWFIDIEIAADKSLQTKKTIYIPSTIYEDSQSKITKSESKTSWLIHATCIISIVCIFIII